MTKRSIMVAVGFGVAVGCGGDAGSHEPDFSVCAGTPALMYAPGLAQGSTGGAFTGTVTVASTEKSPNTPPVDAPAIGFNRWTVAITDAGGAPVMNLTVTADKPRMPIHGHGAPMPGHRPSWRLLSNRPQVPVRRVARAGQMRLRPRKWFETA